MKTDIQKFRVETISRSRIKNAPYNPRKIKKTNREGLEKSIGEFGLIEPLVWNEKTGNLVSGHQRLKIIDAKNGNPDYELDVAVVGLDGKDEARANIAMNNRALQGDFDFPKLRNIAEEFGLDLLDDAVLDIKTGFDEWLNVKADIGRQSDIPEESVLEKVPLAIVLGKSEYSLWVECKERLGLKNDTKAFIKILVFWERENK
jgi:hypothetical protein